MRSLKHILCGLAVITPVIAQDYAFDRMTPGTLGSTLKLSYTGAPQNKTVVFAMSMTGGPTPLSLLNSRDSRILKVGLDATFGWIGQKSTGQGNIALPVPTISSMHGAIMHWQTFSIPGNPYPVGKISNNVLVQFGWSNTAVALPSQLPTARAMGSTFPTGKPGEFIQFGGSSGNLSTVGLDTSEYFDARTLSVRNGPRMTMSRAYSTITRLKDGRVLIAGGADNASNVLSSCELYDPRSGRFVTTGSMTAKRALHSATLLNDGRILVVGGTPTFVDVIGALRDAHKTSETYDPRTGQWTRQGSIADRRLLVGLATLPNGLAIASGGFEITVFLNIPIPVGTVTDVQFFNPSSGSWSNGPLMKKDRAGHGFNSILLGDGRLFVAGGFSSGANPLDGKALSECEMYDYRANAWSSLPPMNIPRAMYSIAKMPSGRVLVAGGGTGILNKMQPTSGVQEFNPATNNWQTLNNLTVPRIGPGTIVTPDGLLVLAGGVSTNNVLKTLETIRQ
ncbi:MAG: kelch repeat-containing protein [Planctomycetota bacterium]|nr:kelch repeat-containing protein [Planctomycetota bacterium]